MKTKYLLLPLSLTLAISTFTTGIEAPLYTSISSDERKIFDGLIQERKKQERLNDITKILTEYPSLSFREAHTIIDINQKLEIKQYESKKDGEIKKLISADMLSLLTDSEIHKNLFWANYDQLPDAMHEPTLEKLFKEYALVLTPQFIVDKNALLNIPEPVLLSKYFLEIKKWTKKWSPSLNLGELHLMEDLATAILLQESFATRAAILNYTTELHDSNPINKNKTKKSDFGLFQISPYARSYLMKNPNFKGVVDEDFNYPDLSIKAGTYWLSQCLKESRNDFLITIACYNAGILEARENTYRAQEYSTSVLSRLSDYLIGGKSKTLNYSRKKAAFAFLKNPENF